jgi:hypothetical protein
VFFPWEIESQEMNVCSAIVETGGFASDMKLDGESELDGESMVTVPEIWW